MKVYVQDAHANKQINTIASFVEDGLSDSEITEKLLSIGFRNLARDDGNWSATDIKGLRDQFNLNTAYGFNPANQKEEAGFKKTSEVSLVDIKMPFSSMVIFMVKWAIASIPAIIILLLIGTLVSTYAAVILGLLVNQQ